MMAMKEGDLALFYHSNAKPSGVVGIMKIVKEAVVDGTAYFLTFKTLELTNRYLQSPHLILKTRTTIQNPLERSQSGFASMSSLFASSPISLICKH